MPSGCACRARGLYAAHGISFWYDEKAPRNGSLVKRQFVLQRRTPISVQGFFDLVHTDAMGGAIRSLCLHNIRMEEVMDYNEDGVLSCVWNTRVYEVSKIFFTSGTSCKR